MHRQIFIVTFEKYLRRLVMQAPSLIIPVKTQTKFKQWLELLSTNSLGRAQLLHLKFNFGEKNCCFSKFEQCSNCGQNGVLS